MNIKLLTEHKLEFLSLTGGNTGRLSLHVSKCHIVESHMAHIYTTLLPPYKHYIT